MNDYLSNIPLIGDLTTLVKVLLIFNAVLIGAVILLGFRAIHYKQQVDDLKDDLSRSVNEALEADPGTSAQRRGGRTRK